MTTNEIKRLGEVLIKIGQNLKNNPSFISQLEGLLKIDENMAKQISIDFDKINNIDLFQLIREKTEGEVEQILSDYNIKELRELLKKYHFGSSSKLKTVVQIKAHILNQLVQRKTDVFHTHQDGDNTNIENTIGGSSDAL